MTLYLPPASPLNPQSIINLHMPASDLTCFDPSSPSQPTPAPPAMSARSHHALSPPRTTRCRPIRASPEVTRPSMHRPMPIIKDKKRKHRRPPPSASSEAEFVGPSAAMSSRRSHRNRHGLLLQPPTILPPNITVAQTPQPSLNR